MKIRDFMISVLLILAVAAFSIIHFYALPQQHREQAVADAQYNREQQAPETHHLNSILKYQSKYMGDASNLTNLFYNLPLGENGMNYHLFPEEFKAEINYEISYQSVGADKAKKALLYNAVAAFSLIDNLEKIHYNFSDYGFNVSRKAIEGLFDDFSDILSEENWKAMQENFKDEIYVDNAVNMVLIQD